MRYPVFASLVLTLGCSQPRAPTGDAGMDAGARDAAVVDGSTDAGADTAIPDTGAMLDAPVIDVLVFDTGVDAGIDAALVDDAGIDSGSDAGHDGGTDSAIDAAITTCSIGVTPTSGTTTDSFTFDLVSNGSACTVSVDSGAPLSVPCTVSSSFAGSLFGVGTHDVRLSVGGGPSGATSCSTSFRVDPAPDAGPRDGGPDAGVTTCTVSVTPGSGTTADTYTFMSSSNGSACAISVDGGAPQPIPCNSTYATMAAAGTHSVMLTVGAGPGGPTTCSTSVTVSAPPDAGPRDAGPDSGVTTCTIDVTPGSGSTTTNFVVTATSNGAVCAVRLDGGAPLTVPCTGSMSLAGSLFGVGSHTLTLEVSAGPGGATSCADTFVVTP